MDWTLILLSYLLAGCSYGVLAVVYLEHSSRQFGDRFTWTDVLLIFLLVGVVWPMLTVGLLLVLWEVCSW